MHQAGRYSSSSDRRSNNSAMFGVAIPGRARVITSCTLGATYLLPIVIAKVVLIASYRSIKGCQITSDVTMDRSFRGSDAEASCRT